MHYRLIVALLCIGVLSSFARAQIATHPVISEVLVDGVNESSAATNDEFVEIYNPTLNDVDVSGWTVDYRSASGTGTYSNKFTFPAGTSLPGHRYFLVGGGGVAGRDNSAASILMGLGNAGGGVFLRNSSGTVVDLLGWGTAVAANYEGAVKPSASQGVSLERKADSSSTSISLGSSGADEFAGNGWDTNNNSADFVTRATPQPQNSLSAAEPSLITNGNGSGRGAIYPNVVYAASTSDLNVTLLGDSTFVLDSILVTIPSTWNWSHSTGSVGLVGPGLDSATVSLNGDTLVISGGTITKTDTGIIVLHSMTAPDSALTSVFAVRTAISGGTPIQIVSTLSVAVLKVVPIINLHINNSQGVPVAPYAIATNVTVSGIMTGDYSTTQTNIFLQDATAGVCVFSYNRSYDYQVGDSISVTGTITQFRGLIEISPDSAKTIIYSHGHPLPEPMVMTAADVNETFNGDTYSEPNEGRLVRINSVTYSAANSTITDATGTTGTFISSAWPTPGGTFDLIGIIKQYKPGTPAPPAPYTGDYEVVPRTADDIILLPGPVFTVPPHETDIDSSAVTIAARTFSPAQAFVRYGLTASYTDSIGEATAETTHALLIPNLQPSTIYHYQVGAKDTSGTNITGDGIFGTGSPAGSSGTIDVFFSKSVDTSVARGEKAQTVNIVDKFIARVNAAQHSIDVALYSLSGTVGSNVATALLNARGRGVAVRMIVENDNSSTAPMTSLKNSGMPFITDTYDAVNAGNGLMHNKFAVFDYRDKSSASDDWVWSGSWNATDPGNDNDAQNALEIQDQALAQAYTIEFNEMWGSSTDSPNALASRFGIRKSDNTPHFFLIRGTPIELYFSPSDHTTQHIQSVLNHAVSSISVAMLTLTRDDLAAALIGRKLAGEKVRVLLDNNTDTGNQFTTLSTGGVDIHLKASTLGGLLHHKYAVIDADKTGADQTVITGSHNWSSSAETSNNENTLILHSARIANLYLQEFRQRYLTAGGTDSVFLAVRQQDIPVPTEWTLDQNFPNPFNPSTTIRFGVPSRSRVRLAIYDLLGRLTEVLVDGTVMPGVYTVQWNASRRSSGTYFYRLEAGATVMTRRLLLLK